MAASFPVIVRVPFVVDQDWHRRPKGRCHEREEIFLSPLNGEPRCWLDASVPQVAFHPVEVVSVRTRPHPYPGSLPRSLFPDGCCLSACDLRGIHLHRAAGMMANGIRPRRLPVEFRLVRFAHWSGASSLLFHLQRPKFPLCLCSQRFKPPSDDSVISQISDCQGQHPDAENG